MPKSTTPGGALPSPLSKRRTNLMKRRYKSGIPLASERGHDDPLEESYLRNFSLASAAAAAAASKTSKDDSDISLTAAHSQQDSLYHSASDAVPGSSGGQGGCHVAAHHKQVARDGEYLFGQELSSWGFSPRN